MQLIPGSPRVAVIAAPENAINAKYWTSAQLGARGRVAEMVMIAAHDDAQIERDIGEFARTDASALLVLPGASTIDHRAGIVGAAARHRLPAIYPFRVFAASGGLMSYGSDTADNFRRAAGYVDRLLRGDSIANLPVQFPTKYDLVINLKTANTLGLSLPATLLSAADEVIE
jgi:putative tryptophan/tyrosine transport system substrate-binding protein